MVLNPLKESNIHLKTCQVFVGSFMKLNEKTDGSFNPKP